MICSSEDPAKSGDRYVMELSVIHQGVAAVSARSILQEGGSSTLSLQDADGVFDMNAQLSPIQGDGEADKLYFSVSISDGERTPQEPNLVIRRGGDAQIVIGQEGPDGVMFEGLKISLTPSCQAE